VNEDDEESRGLVGWISGRLHILIGIAGLVAWFIMLWLMFGDVL